MAGGAGWVILSRKLFDSDPDWNEPREFSRFEAWVDIIQMTAYAPHRKLAGGSFVELSRGEVLLSVRFLARRWSWSNGRVTRWLKTSTATERLRVQRRTQDGYIYLLPNYDTYQLPWNTNGYTSGTADETERVQQRYTDGYKDNTRNTGKEENEETPLPPAAPSALPAEPAKRANGRPHWKPPDVPIPACLDVPEFRDAWSLRLRERGEPGRRGSAPTATSLAAQLQDLCEVKKQRGIQAAIDCVRRATGSRSMGIVFDNSSRPAPAQGRLKIDTGATPSLLAVAAVHDTYAETATDDPDAPLF